MKTVTKKVHYLITIGLMVCFTLTASADPPGPPVEHGSTTNEGSPAGAPIDGGLGILLALGAAYGIRKIYRTGKEDKEPLTP